MSMLDIFNNDAFSLTALTTAVSKLAPVPGQLTESGLFPAGKGVTTTSVAVELKDGRTKIVPPAPRGAPGQVADRSTRKIRRLDIPHYPTQTAVNADEVQNVRAFGSESQMETVQSLVLERLADLYRDLNKTLEFARMQALKGVIYDAGGNDLDLYQFFGVTRKSVTLNFSAANFDLRSKIFDLVKSLKEQKLQGVTQGGTVFCGDNFWNALIVCKNIRETYLNTQAAADLRGDPMRSFNFGGLNFVWYDGDNDVSVDTNKGIFVPRISGIFETYHAPAPYFDTVNTLGKPFYASQRVNDRNTAVNLELTTDTLILNTCPEGVVDLVLA